MTPALAFTPREEAANFLSRTSLVADDVRRPLDPTFYVAQPAPLPISATVLVKNGGRLLADVLAALAWCDEIVVLDTGSTDGTLASAASFSNVSLHRLNGPFPGFGSAHRHAVALARNDWIFSVDSDEVVSPELAAEIAALPLDPRTVYTIPFQNYYNGKHITTCGWAPDRHERLFNRTATNFCASKLHERVQTAALSVVRLRQPMLHYSYRSVSDFLGKLPAYAQLFSTQNVGKKKVSAANVVARSMWAFFKSYILKRGCLQGIEGLTISAYQSQLVFWKYLMLHEANQRASA